MINHLNNKYRFYAIKPNNIESFITRNFKLLNGKMYRPSQMIDSLIIGIPKGKEDNMWEQIEGEIISKSIISL